VAVIAQKQTRISGRWSLPHLLLQEPVKSRRLIVIASGDAGPLLSRVASTRQGGIEIAQVVNVSNDKRGEGLAATLEPQALTQAKVWAILVSAGASLHVPASLLLQCRLAGIPVFGEAIFWEEEARWIDIDSRDPSWFLGSYGFRTSWCTELAARLFDLVTATALLILTLPVMLIVSLLIKLDSRGPAFYRQERVGLGGKVFMLNKFRSMSCDAEVEGRPCWAQIDDPRITRIGRLIRYTRIDELPQLLNVLRGEMSMVGPRPERPYFVEQLSVAIPFYAARHYIRPGITGWAQVNAPYSASIEDTREKLRYDLYYIKHRSLYLYVFVLLRTVQVVLRGEGAR
jgi:exopolysaccharide biosynthesis polyprenyl glycosylphosphotransferase